MAGWTGKRVNVSYSRTNEPAFLKRFKERVGYKEGNGLEDKFQDLPSATADDLKDNDDELPQVVQLKKGDLSQEEFDKLKADGRLDDLDKDNTANDCVDEDGKILFKKPTKRNSEESTSDLKSSSNKKQKKSKNKDKDSKGKVLTNKKLLSFDDEEDDIG